MKKIVDVFYIIVNAAILVHLIYKVAKHDEFLVKGIDLRDFEIRDLQVRVKDLDGKDCDYRYF